MDIAPNAQPVTAPVYEQHGRRFDRLTVTAFVTIVFAGIVMILASWFVLFNTSVSEQNVFAAIGSNHASPLYTLDTTNSTHTALTVTVDGEELQALDVAPAPDGGWYYLLIDSSDTTVSNLYQKTADGVVTKHTNTLTAKYDLTYSPSGLLSYQEAKLTSVKDFQSTTTEWVIMLYNPKDNTTRSIGIGDRPTFFSNETLLFRNDTKLVAVRLNEVDGVQHNVLTLGSSTVFAVSPVLGNVAIYNVTTHKVDTFGLLYEGLAASYVSSVDLGGRPSAMTYVNKTLLATVPKKANDTTLSVQLLRITDAGVRGTDTSYIFISAPQRLYAYE